MRVVRPSASAASSLDHRCKKNVEIKIKNVKNVKKRDKNKKTFVNVE